MKKAIDAPGSLERFLAKRISKLIKKGKLDPFEKTLKNKHGDKTQDSNKDRRG